MLKYRIIIYWSSDDQKYIGECPELAGCMADGDSYEETAANLELIMCEWIETAKEHFIRIPEPEIGGDKDADK